jgi:hypothetical protein
MGCSLRGSYYAKTRTCTSCYITKPKKEFYNVAVEESLRKYDGLNIRCRDCQKTQYSHGYKEDGFIVSDVARRVTSDEPTAHQNITFVGGDSDSDDDIVIPSRYKNTRSYHGYESDDGFVVAG